MLVGRDVAEADEASDLLKSVEITVLENVILTPRSAFFLQALR